MSKITNNGLTQSDTGCCIAVLYPYGNSWCQTVNRLVKLKVACTLVYNAFSVSLPSGNTGTPPVVSKHRMCSRNGE